MSDFKIVKLLDPIVQLNININPTGVYDPAATYGVGDSVSYGNSSYIAIQATTGNLPTNTTYWQLLATASTNKLETVVRNNLGFTVPSGAAVYLSGNIGNVPLIALSQANTELTSTKTIGITSAPIANNTNGSIIVFGLAENLDTSAFAVGSALWLSPTVAGGLTVTKPSAPDHMVFIGVVTRSHPTAGTIEVKIQNGFELEELHNVSITSVADNQVLKYDAPSLLWRNETLISSDVGLGNVPNVDATQRANHTGTQLSSTISDFTEAAQDSVSSALTNTSTISFSYNDSLNQITADINNSSVTNSLISTGIDAAKIADGSVSNAEFQYINSLTSNAQTQIDAKRDITSIVPIVYGGTGASSEPVARANLGISMTSLYSGGVVSGLGTATFSVTAGLGYIISQTLVQVEPTSVAVNFSAVTGVTPLYTRGIIYVNSAGAILQVDVSLTPITQLFKKQNIILAAYVVFGGIIASMPSLKSTAIATPSKLEDLMEALGPLNLRGNIYSPNGANLLLNKSAGQTFQLKSNIANSLEVRDITTDAAASPISNATTAYGYRNGSGGFTLIPYTGVTPNVWDDGSGTPAAVTNGHFTIQRIYYFNESNSTIIYLGQTEYNTLTSADAAVGTEIRVVDDAVTAATFRSSLVIKRNTTSLTNLANVAFFEASKFGASGAGSSSGTTTLQGAYDNSVTPEIVTNSTLGAITVKRGSAADTDNVIEGQNGAGTTTFAVDGNGKTTTASLVIGSISGLLKSTSGTVSAATAGTDYEPPIGFTPANENLSNLSTTAVNTNIIPQDDKVQELGQDTKAWATGFFSQLKYDSSRNIDIENRRLKNAADNTTVNYEDAIINDKSGILSIDADARKLGTALDYSNNSNVSVSSDFTAPGSIYADSLKSGNVQLQSVIGNGFIELPAQTSGVVGAPSVTGWRMHTTALSALAFKNQASRILSFNTSAMTGNVDLSVGNTTGTIATIAYVETKLGNTFESVSKNLRQYNYALNYTSGVLTSIVYTVPTVGTITKTLNYTSGVLTSVVLSGSTPLSISLTKTLTYTSGVLTAVAYS